MLKFTPTMSIDQMIRDLRVSRVLWRNKTLALEELLDSYRPKVEKK